MPLKTPSASIEFHFMYPSAHPRQRRRLRSFLLELLRKEQTPVSSLSYIFCDDKFLLSINKQFLQHDYYTDIISFNLADKGLPVEGEIYISVERVKDNATMAGEGFERELHRVIFHGALHLCGYKDKSKAQKLVMTAMEDKYLKAYFR